MDLINCNGTYSNECEVSEAPFLDNFRQEIEDFDCKYHPYFTGLCFSCYNPYPNGIPEEPLQRCGGCQLVAYCSRYCQKKDWSLHKHVCKAFPVVKGKNVLHSTGPWKTHITALRERAALLPHAEVASKPIFFNPRVCPTCKEARQDRLTDCKCTYVSYCSRNCSKADKQHREDCRLILGISRLYNYYPYQDNLPSLRDITVADKFTLAFSWNDILSHHWNCSVERHVSLESYLTHERLSYAMSLLFALQSLPERRLGQDHLPLEDLITINVHVVTSIPNLDSEPWEVLLHRLPKIKTLNVTFIMQDKIFRRSFYHNNLFLSLQRCNDCKEKDRVITYVVHKMLYHMYFSSPDYTEPDVVVVFGNSQEMASSGEDDIQSELSYRNMTCNKETVLVLMDSDKDLLKQGVRAVDAAQPVTQIVPPQNNLFHGYTSNLSELDSGSAIINDKSFFTCVKRK